MTANTINRWSEKDPVCIGRFNSVELLPLSDNFISLLVLSYRDDRLNAIKHEKFPQIDMDYIYKMQANTHLSIADVEELVDTLQDYLKWVKRG